MPDQFSARPDDLDPASLPPDLRRLYADLEADGAAWRAEAPEPPGLRRLIRELGRAPASLHDPHSELDARERRHPMRFPDAPPRVPTQATTRPAARPRRRWAGGLVATAAMAAVVALFALMLHGFAGNGPGATPPGGAPADYPTAEHGRWVTLDKLGAHTRINAAEAPAIAPSDPRVVYEPLNGNDARGNWQAGLRRTDDGGQTWHDLALPVPAANVNFITAFVSPLDARHVYLLLSDQTRGADCPSGQGGNAHIGGNVLASGSGFCALEYSSADAGAHWTPVRLPVPGVLTANDIKLPSLLAQGGRLYAATTCYDRDCTRLVASEDGGATWRSADGALVAGRHVCDYGAPRDGSTLFAITSPGDCTWLDQAEHSLWRSDDAGAHWARAGALPTPNEHGMRVVSHAGTDPLLYIDMPRTVGTATDKMGGKNPVVSDAADDVRVSADGGKTWTAAPAAGAPAGRKPVYGPAGVLGDGSILMPFSPQGSDDSTGLSLYAWKAGDAAWRQVTPAVTGGYVDAVFVTSNAGGDTLWAVTRPQITNATQDDGYTIHVFRP